MTAHGQESEVWDATKDSRAIFRMGRGFGIGVMLLVLSKGTMAFGLTRNMDGSSRRDGERYATEEQGLLGQFLELALQPNQKPLSITTKP